MSSQRHSCDRCRQHKVRCLKIGGELQTTSDRGSGDPAASCERCAKAEVPCVYSSRQRKGRGSSHRTRRDSHAPSITKSMPFGGDLPGALPGGSDSLGSALADMSMPFLDMTEMIPGFDDNDFYSWDSNNPTPSSISAAMPEPNEVYDVGLPKSSSNDNSAVQRDETESPVETLIAQIMVVSTRATRATRQLAGNTSPLMVNSLEVNEAFETANALVHIVNSIPLGSSTSFPSPEQDRGPQPSIDCGLIFLALASHQHVLALFLAICSSIQRSVGYTAPGTESKHQQPALHGDGASCAQFVMVLQLIMHLVNRLGRSLRLVTRNTAGNNGRETGISGNPLHFQELTPRVEDEEDGGGSVSASFVDAAQDVLRNLPDEHVKLRQVIQQLQTYMEDKLHT